VFRVRRGLLAGCAVCVVVGHCFGFVRVLDFGSSLLFEYCQRWREVK
jgi:hypothetical protein